MRSWPPLYDERDDRAVGETDSPDEGASSCTEIGSDDGEMSYPVWDVIKTFLFVVAICGGTAVVIAWIK